MADNWRPLLAVADLVGGHWPQRARTAALALMGERDDDSVGSQLLSDLRGLFGREVSGVLFTREILASLHADENRPWPERKSGKPLSSRQLAGLLKGFGIKLKTVRRGDETEPCGTAQYNTPITAA